MIYADQTLTTFNNQEAELLKCFLDEEFFVDREKKHFIDMLNQHNGQGEILQIDRIKKPIGLEIIVRPQCTENCEYCYLQKHRAELNDGIDTSNNDVILRNIDKLLDFIFNKKQTYLRRIELFAGDLFFDNLYFDIIEIIYKYYVELHDRCGYLFTNPNKLSQEKQDRENYELFEIITPLNLTVLKDDSKIEKLKNWVEKFEQLGICLGFSFSSDGPYTRDTREKTAVKDDNELLELLEKMKQFVINTGGGFHPVLAPQAVEHWIENYDWWVKFIEEIDEKKPGFKDHFGFQPPILEVRDPQWTKEKIEKYVELLKHIVDKRLEMCNYSIENLTHHLFIGDGADETLKMNGQYDMINPAMNTRNRMSCSFQSLIHVRATDLAIVPCHRLSYNSLIAGWFEQDSEGNLTGNYIPHNVSSFISAFMFSPDVAPKCITCPIKDFCLKGCLGSQYETNGDFIQPIFQVCDLFIAKWTFLIDYWYYLGVLQNAKSIGVFEDDRWLSFKEMANGILKKRGYDFQI